METCTRCDGTGKMDVDCCNGSFGCSCGGEPVLLSCTYCNGKGKVENNLKAIAKGHNEFMRLHGDKCYLGSGPIE